MCLSGARKCHCPVAALDEVDEQSHGFAGVLVDEYEGVGRLAGNRRCVLSGVSNRRRTTHEQRVGTESVTETRQPTADVWQLREPLEFTA